MWVHWNKMEKHILWHCLHAAGRTIELINGRIRESLWSMGLPLMSCCDLDDIALDGSRFAPVPIEHAQGGRIGEQVYMKLHAVLKKDLSHVLLREGEQVTVEYRIAQN